MYNFINIFIKQNLFPTQFRFGGDEAEARPLIARRDPAENASGVGFAAVVQIPVAEPVTERGAA